MECKFIIDKLINYKLFDNCERHFNLFCSFILELFIIYLFLTIYHNFTNKLYT